MTGPAEHVPEDDGSATADRPPAKQHGDPLLAASEGRTEGTQGSRHGARATQEAGEGGQEAGAGG